MLRTTTPIFIARRCAVGRIESTRSTGSSGPLAAERTHDEERSTMKEIVIESAARNALGIEVMRGLIAQVAAAGSQPILLRGAGNTFSAGLNLKEVAAL